MPSALKRIGKLVLDRTVIPVLCYILDSTLYSRDKTLYNMARWKAVESSLQYVETHLSSVCMLDSKIRLWEYALSKVNVKGTCAEFGVFHGESINYFARKLPAIYGFDSFEGLKEDWKGCSLPKGTFNLHGKMPRVAKNVYLIKGWFNDTVPGFLAKHPEPFAFVHIDSDTYEAANSVLTMIGPHFVAGTVLVFDQFFSFRGWELGEFKAWNDYVTRTGTEFEYLAFTSQRVAIQIRRVP